ncbi:transposase [Leptospira interrogans serovar Canicola]|uniref:Transposase n=1 Tax=Leptospira interrogans serovar Canicola TaxID=211880 RepID=A0AAP9WFN6_LEPIR|nr:transposase [Leptospira interrogans]QOI43339.1 transposase [Leptospira interrogans serovar Canicola]
MAYADIFMTVYELYVETVPPKNAEEISSILKETHPKISANTIRRLIKKHSLEERRNKRQTELVNRVRQERDLDGQILDKIELYLKAAEQKILNKEGALIVEAKSAEGMLNALGKLMELYKKIRDDEKSRFSPTEFKRAIIQAMNDVEEIQAVLTERVWYKFEQALRRNQGQIVEVNQKL